MIDPNSKDTVRAQFTFQTIISFKKNRRIKFCCDIAFLDVSFKIKIALKSCYFIAAFVRSLFVITIQYADVCSKTKTNPFSWIDIYKKSFAYFCKGIVNVFYECPSNTPGSA